MTYIQFVSDLEKMVKQIGTEGFEEHTSLEDA
jgi:hypothetical protein